MFTTMGGNRMEPPRMICWTFVWSASARLGGKCVKDEQYILCGDEMVGRYVRLRERGCKAV